MIGLLKMQKKYLYQVFLKPVEIVQTTWMCKLKKNCVSWIKGWVWNMVKATAKFSSKDNDKMKVKLWSVHMA